MFEELNKKHDVYKALVERKKQLDALLDRVGNNLELAKSIHTLLFETVEWIGMILNMPNISQTTSEKVEAFLEDSALSDLYNLIDKKEAMDLIACYPMYMDIEDKSAEGYLILRVEVSLGSEYRGFRYCSTIHSKDDLKNWLDAALKDYMS